MVIKFFFACLMVFFCPYIHGVLYNFDAYTKEEIARKIEEATNDSEGLKKLIIDITLKMKEAALTATGYSSLEIKKMKEKKQKVSHKTITGIVTNACAAYKELVPCLKLVIKQLDDEKIERELFDLHKKSARLLKKNKYTQSIAAYRVVKSFTLDLVDKTSEILRLKDSDSDKELEAAFDKAEKELLFDSKKK